jgi:hypothetical protein
MHIKLNNILSGLVGKRFLLLLKVSTFERLQNFSVHHYRSVIAKYLDVFLKNGNCLTLYTQSIL